MKDILQNTYSTVMFSVRQYRFCLFNRYLNLNLSIVPPVSTAGGSSQEHFNNCNTVSLKGGTRKHSVVDDLCGKRMWDLEHGDG